MPRAFLIKKQPGAEAIVTTSTMGAVAVTTTTKDAYTSHNNSSNNNNNNNKYSNDTDGGESDTVLTGSMTYSLLRGAGGGSDDKETASRLSTENKENLEKARALSSSVRGERCWQRDDEGEQCALRPTEAGDDGGDEDDEETDEEEKEKSSSVVSEPQMTWTTDPRPCQQYPTDLSFKPSLPARDPEPQHSDRWSAGKVDSDQQAGGGLYSKLLLLDAATAKGEGEGVVKSGSGPSQPRKRPSDFSTAFLLSHQPAHSKRPRSIEVTNPSSLGAGSDVSSTPAPSPRSAASLAGVPWWLENQNVQQHVSASGLAATTAAHAMLGYRAGPVSPFHGLGRDRSASVTSTSSLEAPSPVHGPKDLTRVLALAADQPLKLSADEGPSAFRRGGSALPQRDSGLLLAASSLLATEGRSPDVAKAHHGRRGVGLASPRETARTSPYDLLSLSRPGEMRRGTSTSPAHSERTSSGCGSPPQADSPSNSPTHSLLPAASPADASGWGGTALLSPGSRPPLPFLPPFGLPYLPQSLPCAPKGLPLPLPYSAKTLADSLAASAFSPSTRSQPPYLPHPGAAAAYYNSLRSSLSLPPFPFSYPGAAQATASPKNAADPEAREGELLRQRIHNAPSPYDSHSSAFQPLVASSTTATHRGVSPAAASDLSSASFRLPATALSPAGLAPSGPDSCQELATLPHKLSSPRAGLASRGKEPHEAVRYNCEDCSKSYSTHSGLSKHKQFHCAAQVKKEFSCKYCEKSYTSLGALKMHIRTHTLPCKCSVCGKAFSRPWLLQGHVRTHTGEKPFSCQHCQRAFADRSNLRAHLQTHSHVKKYSCPLCHKTFSRMSLLLKHEDQCQSPGAS